MTDRLILPPLEPSCSLTVAIPARNEELSIGRTVSALASQAGRANFEVVVFANNCTDSTAEQARIAARMYPQLRLHVVEGTLPAGTAHVGAARKLLLDGAAERLLAARKPKGILATTDADTIVAPDWVANTQEEMLRADAVAGLVEIAPDEQRTMLAAVRSLYARETALRRALTDLEDLIDPRPEDPPPRHGAFVGASFAVTAETYVRAGGLPQVPCLEDREFMFALRRIDARIRHSLRVRAFTSGRREARVPGGFGTFIDHLHRHGSIGETFLVEDPRMFVRQLRRRALYRRLWQADPAGTEAARIAEDLANDVGWGRAFIDRTLPFGYAYERATALSDAQERNYPPVSVDRAIELAREAFDSRNAVLPTLATTASGAG